MTPFPLTNKSFVMSSGVSLMSNAYVQCMVASVPVARGVII
jgi:hypothetical protein